MEQKEPRTLRKVHSDGFVSCLSLGYKMFKWSCLQGPEQHPPLHPIEHNGKLIWSRDFVPKKSHGEITVPIFQPRRQNAR